MKEVIVNPNKIRTIHYQYHDVPVDVSYYFSNICHISFPSFKTGIYRNGFTKEDVMTVYADASPKNFWERYLDSLFLERIDIQRKYQYNEVTLTGGKWFRYFYSIIKSMLITGELQPVQK